MTEEATIPTFDSFKMLRAMVGIGIICGVLIVFTYEATLPRIEQLKEAALQEAIFKVLPGISQTKAFSYQNGIITGADENSVNVLYAGYDADGAFKGIAVAANGQGYAGTISVLYGYDPEKEQVIGFYILESKETPGLGDKIEKDPTFLANFTALDVALNANKDGLENAVITVKSGAKVNDWEVDGITGATISSRAIGVIIDESATKWGPIIYTNLMLFKSTTMPKQKN